MSLPDGEYEIDLAGLVDHPNRNNVALRFLFLPDSFDPTKPLTMYEGGSDIVIDSDGTLFEGIGLNRTSLQQEYYLTVHDNRVALKHLHNTIRVNKTRQPDKLRQQIRQWDKQKLSDDSERHRREQERLKRERDEALARDHQRKLKADAPSKPTLSPRPSADDARRPPPQSRSHDGSARAKVPAKPVKVSSKRPPAPKEDAEEIIISDGDFDDLEVAPSSTSTTTIPKHLKNPPKSEVVDIDDEFDDLEHQLAEVLEPEPKPSSTTLALDELDESDFDEVPFSGIAIDGAPEKKAHTWSTTRPSTKPVSLREAMGGDDDESEEE